MTFKVRYFTSAALVPLMLSACTTLIDPYAKVDKTTVSTADESFDKALAYADALKGEYRSALGDNATLQTIGGLGLLGLSSATTGLGAAGVAGTEILILGLTGSTFYSGGQFLSNQPRQFAYAAGQNAITCAVAVMRPLDLSDNAQFESVQALLSTATVGADSEMDTRIAAVESALTDVRLELAQIPNDATSGGLRTVLMREIEATETALTTAKEARSRGELILNEVAGAPGKLADALNGIRDDVDAVTVRSAQSLSSVPSLIAGLGETYTMFTTVPEALRVASEDTESDISSQSGSPGVRAALAGRAAAAKTKLQALVRARSSMETGSRRIRDFAAALQQSRPDRALSECQVNADEIAPALSVSAAMIEVKTGAAEDIAVTISGGVPEYRIASAPQNEEVTATIPFATQALRINITNAAPVGRHSIVIADNVGANATVTVTVAPEGEDGGGGEDDEQESPLQAAFNALSKDDRRTLQGAVCMQPYARDGVYGLQTSAQLIRTLNGVEAAGDISAVFSQTIASPDQYAEACQRFAQEDLRKINDARVDRQTFDLAVGEGDEQTSIAVTIESFKPVETNDAAGATIIMGIDISLAAPTAETVAAASVRASAITEERVKLAFLNSYSVDENTGTIPLDAIEIANIDAFLTAFAPAPVPLDEPAPQDE